MVTVVLAVTGLTTQGHDDDIRLIADPYAVHESRGGHGKHRLQGVGLDAQHEPAGLAGRRDRRRRRDDDRGARRRTGRVDSRRDARHAQVADEQQACRAPEIDPLVVDRPEGARQKLHRHEPAPARAHDRRGKRDDAPIDRRHRLIRRRDDGLAAIRDREAAGQRVFANRHLEERGEIVERDELAAVAHDRRNRPATVFGDERQRCGRGCVLRLRRGGECDAKERDECAGVRAVTRQRGMT